MLSALARPGALSRPSPAAATRPLPRSPSGRRIAQRTRDTQRIRNESPPQKSASYEERPRFHTYGDRRRVVTGDLGPWNVLAIAPTARSTRGEIKHSTRAGNKTRMQGRADNAGAVRACKGYDITDFLRGNRSKHLLNASGREDHNKPSWLGGRDLSKQRAFGLLRKVCGEPPCG